MPFLSLPRKNRLALAFGRLRGRRPEVSPPGPLPSIPVPAEAVRVLAGPAQFRSLLLRRIAQARRRIILVALYLQDDTSGRELMDALYAAHAAHPDLDIQVLVDQHRAQRGLIGKAKSPGNAAMYQEYATRFGPGVKVLGVPIAGRELFGVLHLKGFIIDDSVLYSGLSLNDVYLARHGRYRLDRYHVFDSAALADCMANLVRATFLDHPAVVSLNIPATRPPATALRALRRTLRTVRYRFQAGPPVAGQVAVTPLVGLGAGNPLNATILRLLKAAQRRLVIYTPYFNLPGQVRRVLSHQLTLGREITIVVGDKCANDFFIPPSEPFKTIGLLPYLYEANLRRFAKTHQSAIAEGRLNIHLWRHGDNSFHLKGLSIDGRTILVTGNNLNPRAWALDLENGLMLQDPDGLLSAKLAQEHAAILKHAQRLASYQELPTPSAYPPQVHKLMRNLNRARLDRLLNRLL